jgi:hypothetical protein
MDLHFNRLKLFIASILSSLALALHAWSGSIQSWETVAVASKTGLWKVSPDFFTGLAQLPQNPLPLFTLGLGKPFQVDQQLKGLGLEMKDMEVALYNPNSNLLFYRGSDENIQLLSSLVLGVEGFSHQRSGCVVSLEVRKLAPGLAPSTIIRRLLSTRNGHEFYYHRTRGETLYESARGNISISDDGVTSDAKLEFSFLIGSRKITYSGNIRGSTLGSPSVSIFSSEQPDGTVIELLFGVSRSSFQLEQPAKDAARMADSLKMIERELLGESELAEEPLVEKIHAFHSMPDSFPGGQTQPVGPGSPAPIKLAGGPFDGLSGRDLTKELGFEKLPGGKEALAICFRDSSGWYLYLRAPESIQRLAQLMDFSVSPLRRELQISIMTGGPGTALTQKFLARTGEKASVDNTEVGKTFSNLLLEPVLHDDGLADLNWTATALPLERDLWSFSTMMLAPADGRSVSPIISGFAYDDNGEERQFSTRVEVLLPSPQPDQHWKTDLIEKVRDHLNSSK